jgi:DNA-binding MarR family transcriptional regulator
MLTAMKNKEISPPDRIQWSSDLIRLEIVLWERIDARLRAEHDLPLAYFESLYFIARSPEKSLRVGDLALALRVTVGGTSKLVDRIERAGLIRRDSDPADRRASRVALTPMGLRTVAAANETYEAEIARVLDSVFSADEQHQMHTLVTRLLTALTHHELEADESTELKRQEQYQ